MTLAQSLVQRTGPWLHPYLPHDASSDCGVVRWPDWGASALLRLSMWLDLGQSFKMKATSGQLDQIVW